MTLIFQRRWWEIVIGMILLMWAVGCSDDNATSPDPDSSNSPYDLEVDLVWNTAVNMDIWIIEPTGKGSGHGDPGETAVNTGNNDCGFGDACSPSSCSDLPCNTPERIVIYRGTALPDTTEPFYHYQIGFSNWSTVTTEMTLTIRTHSASRTFRCSVGGPRVTYIAEVSFPAGTIEEFTSVTGSYCY